MRNKLEFRKDTYNHQLYVPEFWINVEDYYLRMFSDKHRIAMSIAKTTSRTGWEFLGIIEYED